MDHGARGERRIVALLTALVVMLGLLLVAGAVGAVWLARELRAGRVVDEVTSRQRAAAAKLDDIAADTRRAIVTLERRARKQTGVDSGPLDKMAQVIELNQIMVDELFVMLRHLADTQAALASAMRPLPVQREREDDGDRGRERKDVSGRDRDEVRRPEPATSAEQEKR